MSSYTFQPSHFVCQDHVEMEKMLDTKTTSGKDYKDVYKELAKNCDYNKDYKMIAAHEKVYEDTKATYERTWRQCANLGLGICVLLLGIYSQTRK